MTVCSADLRLLVCVAVRAHVYVWVFVCVPKAAVAVCL